MTPQHRQTVAFVYGRDIQLYSQHEHWSCPPYLSEHGGGYGTLICETLLVKK